MSEHVHDYVIEGNVWRCRHCPSELNIPDVYIRIKATEKLSARRVHRILEDRKLYSQDVLALHEYADILRGEP